MAVTSEVGRPAGGPDLASTSPIYDGLRQI
jgi:hypothetical protein